MPPKPAAKKKVHAVGLAALAKSIKAEVTKAGGNPDLAVIDAESQNVDFISTGSIMLDFRIKNVGKMGGMPLDRIVELYGPEHVGKTTMAGLMAVQYQMAGRGVVYVDAERRVNIQNMREMGLQVGADIFQLLYPDSAEQAFDWIERSANAGAGLIILDSIPALLPKQEGEDKEFEAQNMALGARINSKAMRRLTGILSRTNSTVLLINQTRDAIGVMYGNPETTPGGRAIRFFASLRIRIARKGGADGLIGTKEDPKGHILRFQLVKNSFGVMGEAIEVPLIYGEGIDTGYELAYLAQELDLVEVGGAGWMTVTGTDGVPRRFQGAEKFAEYLRTDEVLAGIIREKIEGVLQKNQEEQEQVIEQRQNHFKDMFAPEPAADAVS